MHQYKSSDNVHFLGVVRLRDKLVAASWAYGSGAVDAKLVKKALSSHNFAPQVGLDTHFGHEGLGWHLRLDAEGRIFVLVTGAIYPERLAAKCLQELEKEFVPNFGAKTLTTKTERKLDVPAAYLLKTLCDRFDKVLEEDALLRVKHKVDQTAMLMQDNIAKAVDNGDALRRVETRADTLAEQAGQFRSKAQEANTRTWWIVQKQRILYAAIVIVVLVALLTPAIVYFYKMGQWVKKEVTPDQPNGQPNDQPNGQQRFF